MGSVSVRHLVTGALMLCALAGRVAGDTVFSSGSSLTVYGSSGGNPPAPPTDTAVLTPIVVPTSGVITTSGPQYSSTDTYILNNSQLTVGFDQMRGGPSWAFAQSVGAFIFTVTANTTYDTAGMYTVHDNDVSLPGHVFYNTYLVDLTSNSTFFFQRYNESINTPDVSFHLGSTNGDQTNIVYGSTTGTLFAGHSYELYHNYFIQTLASPGDSGATAGGFLSLGIGGPASGPPSPTPLPTALLGGTLLFGCVGMSKYRRHRKLAMG